MESLLAPKDAGKLLGVTTTRIQQLEREGHLPAIRDSAGRRLFREVDVLRLARERRHQAKRRVAAVRATKA